MKQRKSPEEQIEILESYIEMVKRYLHLYKNYQETIEQTKEKNDELMEKTRKNLFELGNQILIVKEIYYEKKDSFCVCYVFYYAF